MQLVEAYTEAIDLSLAVYGAVRFDSRWLYVNYLIMVWLAYLDLSL